jgi:hypothetical protein
MLRDTSAQRWKGGVISTAAPELESVSHPLTGDYNGGKGVS